MKEFERIFVLHQGAVYGFLLRLCGYDRELAEDLLQETFLRAFLAFDCFRGECQVKTWLIRIGRNCYFEYIRRHPQADISLDSIPENCQSVGVHVEELTENRELFVRSWAIIRDMGEKMRDVMIYRICSDLPYAQIAALLGISASSAKVLFHRGKLLLRKKLREEFGYEL